MGFVRPIFPRQAPMRAAPTEAVGADGGGGAVEVECALPPRPRPAAQTMWAASAAADLGATHHRYAISCRRRVITVVACPRVNHISSTVSLSYLVSGLGGNHIHNMGRYKQRIRLSVLPPVFLGR